MLKKLLKVRPQNGKSWFLGTPQHHSSVILPCWKVSHNQIGYFLRGKTPRYYSTTTEDIQSQPQDQVLSQSVIQAQQAADAIKRAAKDLYEQNKVEESLALYQEALLSELHKDENLSSKKSLVSSYCEIANIQTELDQSTQAMETMENALIIALRYFEENDLDTAQCYIALGEKQSLDGYAEAAIENINKGLYIQLVALGMGHPTVGKTYMDLGMVHHARGLTFEALESYMKALEIFENCSEESHEEDIATLYEFIGDAYCEEERFKEAIDFFGEARLIRKQHEDLGSISQGEKKTLGLICQKIGDCNTEVESFQEAKEAYSEALRIYKEIYGGDSAEVLGVIQQAGHCASHGGSLDEAMDYYIESLRLLSAEDGDVSFKNVEIYKAIANVAFQKGDLDSSIDYDQQVLKFYLEEKLMGRTEDIYEQLGAAYTKQGLKQKAIEVYEEALRGHLEHFGTDHPGVEKFTVELRSLYIEEGNKKGLEELESLLERYK